MEEHSQAGTFPQGAVLDFAFDNDGDEVAHCEEDACDRKGDPGPSYMNLYLIDK